MVNTYGLSLIKKYETPQDDDDGEAKSITVNTIQDIETFKQWGLNHIEIVS
jgi:hypothetical protein